MSDNPRTESPVSNNEISLYKKLLAFQTRVNAIKADQKNPAFKSSSYASLAQIISEVKPVLSEVGLLLLQPIFEGWIETRIIDAETGMSISFRLSLGENDTPHKLGSKITYYRRYSLNSLLALEIEDDDGNEGSIASAKPTRSMKPEPKKPAPVFTTVEETPATAVTVTPATESPPMPEEAVSEFEKTLSAVAYVDSILTFPALEVALVRANNLPPGQFKTAILEAIQARRAALLEVA